MRKGMNRLAGRSKCDIVKWELPLNKGRECRCISLKVKVVNRQSQKMEPHKNEDSIAKPSSFAHFMLQLLSLET